MVSKNIRFLSLFLGLLLPSMSAPLAAQTVATIRGVVTRSEDKATLSGVVVSVKGLTGTSTSSGATGKYTLVRIPVGPQTLQFRYPGFTEVERAVTVTDGMTVDVAMDSKPVNLADITVMAASKELERIVEAPAAVTSIEPRVLQTNSATGQAPMALAQGSGVDMTQSGVNDFNINSRGFNSSLNRRVLTLLDGRDLAIAFLGSQEWNTLPVATDELRSMELVRGPGSALYGANAFAGVIDMQTLSPRESQGGKLGISGGGLYTFKADGRWAGVFGNGAWGVRLNGGYSSSDTWTRSRTSADGLDLQREYAPALGKDSLTVLKITPEAIPLSGQTLANSRTGIGSRDPIKTMYGVARLDHYMSSGVVTLEGGASQAENEVLVTGIGRVQVLKGFKPYARLAYNSSHFNILSYVNHRTSDSANGNGQRSLASGAALIEKSTIVHAEVEGHTSFNDDKLGVIAGASIRQYNVNTDTTLMRGIDDNRHDKVASAFGQVEYHISPKFRVVGAARYDKGDLFSGQFSPKAGIVYSPNKDNGFRFTYNRAFQTPNYSEFFLRAAAAPPADFHLLEAGLRANPSLGPALNAYVPSGTLFTNSLKVPIWARGNPDLGVEKTEGYELGYKGALNERTYVTLDIYTSKIKDFVTDLLPGVNPAFPYWTPPAAFVANVPAAAVTGLVNAIKSSLGANPATALAGAGLTRTEDGNTAVVVSYTNAGHVDQRGLDLGIGVQATNEIRLDGSFSYFHFKVIDQQTGDQLLPNTPDRKATFTASYEGKSNGIDASLSARFVAAYNWAAGVFVGKVPDSQSWNASVGYQMTPRYRLGVMGTNIFDQKRYQLFGGSVIRRRLLASLTARF